METGYYSRNFNPGVSSLFYTMYVGLAGTTYVFQVEVISTLYKQVWPICMLFHTRSFSVFVLTLYTSNINFVN